MSTNLSTILGKTNATLLGLISTLTSTVAGHTSAISSILTTLAGNGVATPSPTVNTLMARDGNGRAQVVNPSAANDIANKTYVDSVVGQAPALSIGASINSSGSPFNAVLNTHHPIDLSTGNVTTDLPDPTTGLGQEIEFFISNNANSPNALLFSGLSGLLINGIAIANWNFGQINSVITLRAISTLNYELVRIVARPWIWAYQASSFTAVLQCFHTIDLASASGNIVATLPTAVGCAGAKIQLKIISLSTSNYYLQLNTTSGQTVEFQTSGTIQDGVKGHMLELTSDGSNWWMTTYGT